MKNVLMLYPILLFYKIPVFNELFIFLKSSGWNLTIWPTEIQNPNNEISFDCIEDLPMNRNNFRKVLKDRKIDLIINILFKSDPGYGFYIYSVFYPRIKGIKVVFYGHGINKQKESIIRNAIYNITYFFFDGLILYSPNEKKQIWKLFHNKTTVANNTILIKPPDNEIKPKDQIRSEYGFEEEKIILSTGRLQGRKRIEVLLEIFRDQYLNSPSVRWILVGPELEEGLQQQIKKVGNITYLGAQYNKQIMAEIFKMSDIYCVPGALGIGIVEAIYWGLPIVTLDVRHGPERYYLKDGVNGYIANSAHDLSEKLDFLLNNESVLREFSDNARKIYEQEATLEKMFSGFTEQLSRFN